LNRHTHHLGDSSMMIIDLAISSGFLIVAWALMISFNLPTFITSVVTSTIGLGLFSGGIMLLNVALSVTI